MPHFDTKWQLMTMKSNVTCREFLIFRIGRLELKWNINQNNIINDCLFTKMWQAGLTRKNMTILGWDFVKWRIRKCKNPSNQCLEFWNHFSSFFIGPILNLIVVNYRYKDSLEGFSFSLGPPLGVLGQV